MSESEVQLRLTCSNEAAQLFVVNGEFRIVANGVSPLDAKLQPGIYALKAKIGDAVTERIEVLRKQGSPYGFELEAPRFESAIPIDGTSSSHEYHSGEAGSYTGNSPQVVTLGDEAAFVLFVRDSTRTNFNLPESETERYAANFNGFRLLSSDGTELVDFDKTASKHIDLGYIGAQVGLKAGHYVLAWQHGDERLCLPAPTVKDRSLQIFLRLQPVNAGSIEMRPDFREASYIFDSLTAQFSPERKDLKLMEAVRLALAKGRNTVTAPEMRDMLTAKFENPMLGLYAAHILLLDPKRDLELLGTVIHNTGLMLGMDFPDVVALAWQYEQLARKRPEGFGPEPWPDLLKQLKGPPLLMRSWDLLVACSTVTPEQFGQIPAFRIAGDLVGAGIYPVWQTRILKPTPHSDGLEQVTVASGIMPAWISNAGSLIAQSSVGELAKSKFGQFATILPEALRATVSPGNIIAAEIRTPADAALALRTLAHKYRWQGVVSKLRSADRGLAQLTGLQRDMTNILRQTATDRRILPGLNDKFVESLLSSNRIPLDSLAEALAGLDKVAAEAR